MLSSKDKILKRLAELKDERHVSPMIFQAATRQDYMTCSQLIREGVDPNVLCPGGRSLIHFAAMTGEIQLLRTLSSETYWSPCKEGKLPLDYAACNNHLKVIDYLLDEEKFSQFENIQKLTILIELADHQGHNFVHHCISQRLEPIQDQQNEQLFKEAVSRNDIKKVKEFLEEDISETSALLEACKHRFDPLVSFLLSSTFDGFSYDKTSAIRLASKRGEQDLLVLLLCGIDDVPERKQASRDAYGSALGSKRGKGKFNKAHFNGALRTAVFRRSLPLVQFFVENGADVDSRCPVWGPVLQYAASMGCFDVVRYLVSEGADINAPGRLGGSSPLMVALLLPNHSMFEYFLDLQIPLNSRYSSLGNILQTVSYRGRQDLVEKVLSSGFDINARLEPYGSALIMAIQGGCPSIAKLLISQGADTNIGIPKYGTALHLAAEAGVEDIVMSLIRAGANVNAEGGDFGIPLQAAAANGHQLIVLSLLDSGADVNIQGGKYGNALKAAQIEGHKLLAKLLLFSGARVTEEYFERPLDKDHEDSKTWD